MQHELRPPAPRLADPLVQVHLLPAGERLRLGGLKVRLHRKVGAREVQRVFPVRHVYPFIVVRDGGVRGTRLRRSADMCAARPGLGPLRVATLRLVTGDGPSARSSTWNAPWLSVDGRIVDAQEELTGDRRLDARARVDRRTARRCRCVQSARRCRRWAAGSRCCDRSSRRGRTTDPPPPPILHFAAGGKGQGLAARDAHPGRRPCLRCRNVHLADARRDSGAAGVRCRTVIRSGQDDLGDLIRLQVTVGAADAE